MNIMILGAGAMGALVGGYLSRRNLVWLVDVDAERVRQIEQKGVRVREQDGSVGLFHPHAVVDSADLPEMDLVIVFVKAMHTLSALQANRARIGPRTYLMTLQNGAGHEARLLRFADKDHVIIGSTQHNSSVIESGFVNHGGGGKTSIGLLSGANDRISPIVETFMDCGFACSASDTIKAQIWNKLFLNTSASALTAVLQVPMGFILDDPHACALMEALVREAVAVANAEGLCRFDPQQVTEEVKKVLANAKGGYTSIYADVKAGVCSEVDTISGSVVETAGELGVAVPCHEMLVHLIHAMEHRMRDPYVNNTTKQEA